MSDLYNPRSVIDRKDEYRDPLVKRGAMLSANCAIVCGVTMNGYAFIGESAVVNSDMGAYALMAGMPAQQIGWMSRHGQPLGIPSISGETVCAATGTIYRLRDRPLRNEGAA